MAAEGGGTRIAAAEKRRRKTQPAAKEPPKALPFTRDPLWYKDAVIYQLHVKSFYDGNNDGIGDFAGLIQKLDYIAELGVNTIWLLPFYPSPRRDDGYDISMFQGVHPDYGTLQDARRFVAQAHKRGLRVITELVVNHTSDQHPWFQRARRAKPGSAARNFYVWSDSDQKYAGTRIIFLDTEKSNWTWDPVANAYFWHRFYSHQPDLNFDNPQVLKAVLRVMRFWLDLGVDGLRLDAVPYLIEREGSSNENNPETHDILRQIRAALDARYQDRMLLAEANMWPEDVRPYFGAAEKGGDECHMAFHFPLMPRMYMALAQEDRFPVTDILRQTPEIPSSCQWAIFLRNHDELTLEMVTDKERDYLWEKYASDKRARLNLGIRRRLAPLLERDRRRIELLNALLLSMPGTPVIYYGDELGMGDNIYLGDRDGVRTPMQWSLDRSAGFSRADPATLVLPPIMDPLYGYQAINVEAQSRDPHSLLNWMRRMLAIRKQSHAFGRGRLKLLYPTNRRILAYLRVEGEEGCAGEHTILCVANVSRSAQAVELDLSAYAGCVPVEMVGGCAFPPIGQLPYLLTLPPYGFFWFLLASHARMPAWHSAPPEPMPDFTTFVLKHDVSELLQGSARETLEREVLPAYLPKRRWFGAKDQKLTGVKVAHAVRLPDSPRPIMLVELETTSARAHDHYLLPVGYLAESETITALPSQLALARVRRGRNVGYLTDAFTLDGLAHGIVEGLRKSLVLDVGDGGEVRFLPTSRMGEVTVPHDAEIRRLAAEQSNSSLVIGNVGILKLIRKVSSGLHPEAEMGRALTERGFRNIATMLGEVARIDRNGTPHVLAVLQGFIHNQGDAWAWTQNMLTRAIQDATTTLPAAKPTGLDDASREFAQFATVLGRRLGQMHAVLAQDSDDPAFAPERATDADVTAWRQTVRARLAEAFEALESRRDRIPEREQALVATLKARRSGLEKAIDRLAAAGAGSLRTRTHGDLHLGQILVAQGDAFLIDFEGEPARPLPERRAKNSPLRDVAGMIRSFDYAAAMAAAEIDGVSAEGGAAAAKRDVVTHYRRLSVTAFLDAYRETSAPIPHAWRDDHAAEALTTLFIVEKAAYEIAYEAANRPDWLRVPLRGLAAVADRLLDDAKSR
ncbi:MAG TPA: maltose alpha-D-glucosyltransferase [Nevskiaceae bacterium]|nr:maltose alpha-D-glucosyltransferase [Nevskiaceae bacterium]